MKKKLEAELLSIAHRILKLTGRDDLAKLHQEAQKLTEALAILRFYEAHLQTVSSEIAPEKLAAELATFLANEPQISISAQVAEIESTNVNPVVEAEIVVATTEKTPTTPEEIHAPVAEIIPVAAPVAKQISLEDFLTSDYKEPEFVKLEKIDIAVQQAAEVVFEKAPEPTVHEESQTILTEEIHETTEEVHEIVEEIHEATPEEIQEATSEEIVAEAEPIIEKPILEATSTPDAVVAETPKPIVETPKTAELFSDAPLGNVVLKSEYVQSTLKTESKTLSLNDRLTRGINIGLNDRIAFVKHLFDSNNEDYNRVISQLNTFNAHEEALSFIENMVKPDHNHWEGKEDYELRFMNIIEKKFL
ncbi:MAG: hypothetical protein ACOVLC_12860 [Flavobacterium sp.]